MLNRPKLGAALITLSSCCPNNGMIPIINGCPEPARVEFPATVEIAKSASINTAPLADNASPSARARKRRYRIPVPNPIIDTQQQLWDCIFELKPHLMMECMEPVIDSANCYNGGVNEIIDANRQIPECRAAADARYNGNDDTLVKKAMTKEAQCLNVVMENDPDVLIPLNPCFDEELACLRDQIRLNSLVCTLKQQEALYGI